MTEQPPHQGGLNPNFNLADSMAQAEQQTAEFDMPIAAAKAAVIAGQIEGLKQDNKQLRTEAETDSMTGLLNQKAWFVEQGKIIEKLEDGDDLIFYVMDLDGFKGVNDKLGHPAGDRLLGLVGQAQRETFQRSGEEPARGSREGKDQPDDPRNVARLGGDEFAVATIRKAVANQDLKEGQKVRNSAEEEIIEQTKRVNENLQISLKGTEFEGFKIKLSVGAEVYQPGDTVETLFARADLKMFEAKYRDKIENFKQLMDQELIDKDDIAQIKRLMNLFHEGNARVESWILTAVEEYEQAA